MCVCVSVYVLIMLYVLINGQVRVSVCLYVLINGEVRVSVWCMLRFDRSEGAWNVGSAQSTLITLIMVF
jgi:hypothetical protein